MNCKELQSFFKQHLVPSHLYRIKGDRKNRICLSRSVVKGKKEAWELYFRDKKEKVGLLRFSTENEACLRMKEEVLKLMEQIYGLSWRGLA